MLINGQILEKPDKIEIRNPYIGKVVDTVSALNDQDVVRAINVAKKYNFSLSGYERYEILSKTAYALRRQKEEFAKLITNEIGISLKDSLHEVDRSFHTVMLAAEEAKRIGGEIPPAEVSPGYKRVFTIAIREPVGIVCCITPFNHPLNQVVHKICPALSANNSVILKPSDKSPLTALKFAKLLLSNGLPPDMLQVITGYNDTVGPILIQHPDVNMISFTGSTSVGEYIARSCGIKKLSLELGGNDVIIIAPDADIKNAAEIVVEGAFGNSGQRCSSIKRIITFPNNAEAFAEKLAKKAKDLTVGNPMDPSTDVGTVINDEAALNIERRINAAIKEGAILLAGHKRNNALLWPTVLDKVNPKSELVEEETFGPVAPIIRTTDFDDAIKIANATKYGLNAAIMTNDLNLAFEFSKRLNVGGIRINKSPSFRNEFVPFGGNKMSGFGRSGIRYAIQEMTNLKTIIF